MTEEKARENINAPYKHDILENVPQSKGCFDLVGKDLRIPYLHLSGKAMTFQKVMEATSTRAEAVGSAQFFRYRHAGKEEPRYTQPKGSPARLYLTGLYAYHKEVSDISREEVLYVVEGEKKAYVMNILLQVPTIGIGGISMHGKSNKDALGNRNPELNPDFTEVFAAMPNLKKIVKLDDADCREGSDKRRANFYQSVRNFKEAMAGQPYELEYAHMTTPQKGIDDYAYTLNPASQLMFGAKLLEVATNSDAFKVIHLSKATPVMLAAYFFSDAKADLDKAKKAHEAFMAGSALDLAKFVAPYFCTMYVYVPETDSFRQYNGKHWETVAGINNVLRNEIAEFLRDTFDAAKSLILGENEDLSDKDLDKRQKSFAKMHSNLGAPRFVDGIITALKGITGFCVSDMDFDAKDNLLNCQNGELDVFTKTLHAHNPKSYLTKICRFSYKHDVDPFEAAHCKFVKSLRSLMGYKKVEDGDDSDTQRLKYAAQKRAVEAMKFWQQFFGVSLTTITHYKQFVYLHGAGDDGKSGVTNFLAYMLGTYAGTINEAIMTDKGSNKSHYDQYLYELKGLRFAIVPEMSTGKINEAAIKAMTGGDIIKARALREMPISFKNSATLAFVSNYAPKVMLADNAAMQSRLVVCHFPERIVNQIAMPVLIAEWEAEGDLLLSWALEGLHNYLQQSKAGTGASIKLFMPQEWRDALDVMIDETDVLKDFLLEKSDGKNAGILQGERCSEVYKRYLDYCKKMEITPSYHSMQALNAALKNKGYTTIKGTLGRTVFIKGYALSKDANGNDRLIAE